jgi:hypothetical protein
MARKRKRNLENSYIEGNECIEFAVRSLSILNNFNKEKFLSLAEVSQKRLQDIFEISKNLLESFEVVPKNLIKWENYILIDKYLEKVYYYNINVVRALVENIYSKNVNINKSLYELSDQNLDFEIKYLSLYEIANSKYLSKFSFPNFVISAEDFDCQAAKQYFSKLRDIIKEIYFPVLIFNIKNIFLFDDELSSCFETPIEKFNYAKGYSNLNVMVNISYYDGPYVRIDTKKIKKTAIEGKWDWNKFAEEIVNEYRTTFPFIQINEILSIYELQKLFLPKLKSANNFNGNGLLNNIEIFFKVGELTLHNVVENIVDDCIQENNIANCKKIICLKNAYNILTIKNKISEQSVKIIKITGKSNGNLNCELNINNDKLDLIINLLAII